LVVAEARRLPTVAVTVTEMSSTPPDVVIVASANRVLPLHPLAIATRVWSAMLMPRTRSAIRRACSRDSGRERSSGPGTAAGSRCPASCVRLMRTSRY
jgi:hypothetical protein